MVSHLLSRGYPRRIVTLAARCAIAVALLGVHARSDESVPLEDPSVAERLVHEALQAGIEGNASKREQDLQRALREDPECAPARWQLGQVRVEEQWLTVDDAERWMAQDDELGQYRQLRDLALQDPRREVALARWCHKRQIDDAERLHLYRVLANASSSLVARKEAMRRLGLKPHAGVLMTEEEIERFDRQVEQYQQDLEKWTPLVKKWREAIESNRSARRERALAELRAVKDPAAIPVLEMLVSTRNEDFAHEVVSILGNIPDHSATRSLVRHALGAPWIPVADAAVQQLKRRPIHDYAPLLLQELVAPVQSAFQITVGPDGSVWHQHTLFREGVNEMASVTANSVTVPSCLPTKTVAVKPGSPELRQARAEQMGQLENMRVTGPSLALLAKVRAMEIEQKVAAINFAIARGTERTYAVLEETSEAALPRSPDAWWDWWEDYNEVYRPEKPTYNWQLWSVHDHYVPWTRIRPWAPPATPGRSCFPEGTKVRTQRGLVNIENIRVGDRVLSQDIETGELAYKLVLQTTERPPSPLLQISLGETAIATTKGHPFWVNNVGWRMAKRLRLGAKLQSIGGGQTVDRIIDLATTAEAYNLVVEDFATYFVGQAGVLVHDNTYRKPTTALTPGLLASRAVPKG